MPHFVGLHALQVLPLVPLALAWGHVSQRRRRHATAVASASYTVLFLLLLGQALSGRPVVGAVGGWGVLFLFWGAASGIALVLALAARRKGVPGRRVATDSTLTTC